MRALSCRCRWLLLIVASCWLAACGGAGPSSEGETAERDSVRVYLASEPASMSLIGKTDANSEALAVQITDSLVQYDESLALRPRVAESWELSEDRLTLTFRLRPGVRWHDGTPVTADDVLFSVEKVRDPATENRTWGSLFRDLESIEAPDPATVVARYSLATPDVLEAWRVPLLPRHLAGLDEDLLTGAFAEHPVGCGPFRFVSREPDQEIVLAANDDYWDGRPAIDRLILKIYSDQRTAYQALLTGELDAMHLTTNLWLDSQSNERAAHLTARMIHTLSVWHIAFNQDGSNPYFADPRVRRAMVLALDRERFTNGVLGGLGRTGVTTYHPDTPWADPELLPWPYDPARARELLAEAGWIDRDGDGLLDRDGEPFRFALMVPVSSQKLVDHMAAWQQESWGALGISMEIDKLEFQAFRERRGSGAFDAASATFRMTPNPDQYELYHSTAQEDGYNFFGFADPEVDRLLEAGRTTFDEVKRVEVYRQLQRRIHDLEALTAVYYFSTPLLHHAELEGVRTPPLGYLRTTAGPRLWSWAGDD